MNETHTSNSDAARARLRKRRVAVFFVVWTALAVAAMWWLSHSAAPEAQPPFFMETDRTAQSSPLERMRVWFKLADLNFRGAYPWLLLAPYIVWLALRFPLERGHLRSRLLIHVSVCAAFAAICHLLTNSAEARGHKIVVIAGYDATTNAHWATFTNRAEIVVNGVTITNPALIPPIALDDLKLTPSRLPTGEGRAFGSQDLTREELQFETNFPRAGIRQITAASWSSALWTAPKPFALLLDLLAYGALLGCAHAVHFYRRFREREQRAVLLESSLAQARLSALQAQLHPHFLFNALNAVATLIRSNPAAALETLTSFSDLLRLALNQSDKHEIPLREDLQFLDSYLEIQQVRLGDRLRIERAIDPAALGCLVPALLTQPLVENALRHGIEPSPNPGVLRFAAKVNGGKLEVTISDNGVGLEASRAANPRPGIGLANLQTRLKTLYGEAQRLEVGPNPGGGVLVRVELPVRIETTGKPA